MFIEKPIELPFTPAQLVLRWPLLQPLIALGSSAENSIHARWSIVARPARVLRASGSTVVDATREIDTTPRCETSSSLPFIGGWIGFIGFEAGSVFEPTMLRGHECSNSNSNTMSNYGDLWFARCDGALVHDGHNHSWHVVGDSNEVAALEHIVTNELSESEIGSLESSPIEPLVSDQEFSDAIRRTIDLIHQGDIFQSNISRPFVSRVRGNVRRLGAAAISRARYGAHLELGEGQFVISASPELFLSINPSTRSVQSRPIKGTRPSGADQGQFERDEKERAELHMIVDLMRNDLARLCEPRSIRVTSSRHLEIHPTILHGVAEVCGIALPHTGLEEVLRCTFPPGSVSGAPKIRAVQVIHEMESHARGPYCGAIGFISDCGRMELSVAIRTALLQGTGTPDQFTGTLQYWAGCGVVAESTPHGETAESHHKTAILELLLAESATAPQPQVSPTHSAPCVPA